MKQGSGCACLSDTFARATARQSSGLTEQTHRAERNRKAQQQGPVLRNWSIATPNLRGCPNLRRSTTSSSIPRGGVVPRAFAADAIEDVANDVRELTRNIEAEVVLESGLHVPGVAAGSCYERFGLPNEVAPPLAMPLPGARATQPTQESDVAVDLAMCLATPSDDERGTMREAVTRVLDDMARQGEIRAEIQNIMNSVEELEAGSQRDCEDPFAPPRPTRRVNNWGNAVEFDADTTEGEGRGVEGNVVELSAGSLRRRPVEAN